jgi:hypothetical protein
MLFKVFPDSTCFMLLLIPVKVGRVSVTRILVVTLARHAGVQLPPPPGCLEKLEKEGRVIATAYETLIVLELLALEVQLEAIALVEDV